MDEAVQNEDMISFNEGGPLYHSWKTLDVTPIKFISYPYEWSFSQLKDAALLTLKLQKQALKKNVTMKDASAYNVQFVGAKPIFIDLLSFEPLKEDKAWQAYRQFCTHFLAPLVLASMTDLRLAQLSRQWIDGIPLDIAKKLLPWRAYLSPGVVMHVIFHAALQNKYADPRSFKDKKDSKVMNKQKLLDIVDSLESTVKSQKLPLQKTEWADYYTDTNYTDKSTQEKLCIVEAVAKEYRGELAVDLGANTGRFSLPLSKYFETVIAADIDPVAVDAHYNQLKKNGPRNILPMILDLSSPSPSLGWACKERNSFTKRCDADLIMALALCHHLFFTVGAPFSKISSYFSKLLKIGGILICEFIPKEDSQVTRMLSSRDDIFEDYTKEAFDEAFESAGFKEINVFTLPESIRTLHVFKMVNHTA